MALFYSISFIPAYDNSHFLDSQIGKTFIQIFFSLSALLFTLSVPTNQKKADEDTTYNCHNRVCFNYHLLVSGHSFKDTHL